MDGKTPPAGRQWFTPIKLFIDFLLAALTGGNKLWFTDAVVTAPLPAVTYANGTLGVGATLTGNANGAFPTVDGVAAVLSQRYLVVGQASKLQNGLYVLTTVGSSSAAFVLTRSTDVDASADWVPGTKFGARLGTIWSGKVFAYSGAGAPTVGTDPLAFTASPKVARYRGVIPSARMAASVNPTANDIAVTIGGVQFKVVAALGAAAAFVQVLRGGSAAVSYANLVLAINGDAATAGVNWLEATTPFSKAVTADMVTATQLRVRQALARGDLPIAGASPSIALLAAVTAGAAAWTLANLNEVGDADTNVGSGAALVVITTAQITADKLYVEFPFTPTKFMVQARTAAGLIRQTVADGFTISGDAVVLDFDGGVAPSLQNTDLLTVAAWQ